MLEAWGNPIDMFRLVSNLVAVAATGLLTWRLLMTWGEMTVLTHMLAALVLVGLVLGAFFTYEVQLRHEAFYWSGIPLFVYRLGALILAATWPWWMHRRTSPLKKPWAHRPSTD